MSQKEPDKILNVMFNPMREKLMPVPFAEKLDNALSAADKATSLRPGTADSDVNALTIEYGVPRWALDILLEAAWRYRGLLE